MFRDKDLQPAMQGTELATLAIEELVEVKNLKMMLYQLFLSVWALGLLVFAL